MKISEIYSAMGLKIKLTYEDTSGTFQENILIRIEPTNEGSLFLVSQYGEGAVETKSVLCGATTDTSDYLKDLFEGERSDAFRCMFLITGVETDAIEVQTYTFRSITEYKTPVTIVASDKLLEKFTVEKLKNEYVWTQLGMPALFCLNYKRRKKQESDIRFVGGKRFLIAHNTPQGIFAESVNHARSQYDVPVDIYIATEIKFITQNEHFEVNSAMSADLEKISNSASYFQRWEAYDALSKKMLEAESEEFGELHYSDYSFHSEVNGIFFEFDIGEELDDSFIGKEIGASEKSKKSSDEEHVKAKEYPVGQIKKIKGNRITTFLSTDDNTAEIPSAGVLKLYTAGDRYIMARRLAARERMTKHRAPIKTIVALIETGTARYELPNAWGNHKAVTEQLRRNFPKANALNPEQVKALEIAINTPDIALIQGPPGTGKTTVIKAICERYREIFEADEKKAQMLNPEHQLRSPKILISSFQNEAVDNAISAPLPGDIPAYRKTAKRANNSSKEQYQRALENWYDGVRDSVNEMIEDATAADFLDKKRELDDLFISYKNAGESLDLAAALINKYLEYVEIPYPQDLISKAREIIMASQAVNYDDSEDPIVAKLESQRLALEAFADDGSRNARRLRSFLSINDEYGIPESTIDIIDVVCDDDFTDDDFEKYISVINKLKKEYCHTKISIDTDDKYLINECIMTLSNTFSRHYLDTLSSIESKKSLILSNFLGQLEQNYEDIVKKYSTTTAATCQTSLDLRDGNDKTFDLVIVDEAARANPLDLFIPMSMGKKIILVGDHKQLPHMLEPDVLKALTDDPRFKDIPELEKSLFERLFEMFSNGQNTKAIPLTHQFRMHPDICSFVSESFYDGMLLTDSSITPEKRKSPVEINNGKALTFVNIPISKGAETPGVSKSRWAEAEAITIDIKHILEIDPDATIGVITFYSAQSKLIQDELAGILNDEESRNVEVGTVDAFQGKEFDYVLLSCVRSNSPKDPDKKPVVGFLEKPNRLCVAFSRSVRQLAVYGDAETLLQIPCFEALYDICSNNEGGCYREY